MRISDWSSDVCSSDLGADDERHQWRRACRQQHRHPGIHDPAGRCAEFFRSAALRCRNLSHAEEGVAQPQARSEEHTSELQSLMRISYAVFCLKKKNRLAQIYKV